MKELLELQMNQKLFQWNLDEYAETGKLVQKLSTQEEKFTFEEQFLNQLYVSSWSTDPTETVAHLLRHP